MRKYRVPAAALDTAREAARRVRALEAGALAALHEQHDRAAHRAGLTDKCLLLADLPDEVEDRLAATATEDTAALLDGLAGFARRAETALSLESIFYMGALLYSEEYEDGQPNDLERFLDRFDAA